jgi:hypothetical protein
LSGVGIEGLAKKVLDFLCITCYITHDFNREVFYRRNKMSDYTDGFFEDILKTVFTEPVPEQVIRFVNQYATEHEEKDTTLQDYSKMISQIFNLDYSEMQILAMLYIIEQDWQMEKVYHKYLDNMDELLEALDL